MGLPRRFAPRNDRRRVSGSSSQSHQHVASITQIRRIETFGEPGIYRSKQIAGFPQSCHGRSTGEQGLALHEAPDFSRLADARSGSPVENPPQRLRPPFATRISPAMRRNSASQECSAVRSDTDCASRIVCQARSTSPTCAYAVASRPRKYVRLSPPLRGISARLWSASARPSAACLARTVRCLGRTRRRAETSHVRDRIRLSRPRGV